MHPIEVMSMMDENNDLHKLIYEDIYPNTSAILNAYLNEGMLNDDDGNELDWEDAQILLPLMNMIVVAILMEKIGDSKDYIKFVDDYFPNMAKENLKPLIALQDTPHLREQLGIDDKEYNELTKNYQSVIDNAPSHQNINTYLDRKICGLVNQLDSFLIKRARQIEIVHYLFYKFDFDDYTKRDLDDSVVEYETRKKVGRRIDDVKKKYPFQDLDYE
jgi:hypothetical protein